MSVELHTAITPPLQLRTFLPKAALNLQRLLNSPEIPYLTFGAMEDGRRVPVDTDELIDRSSQFFLVSIEGEPETVGLITDGESLGIVMGAQRTKREYALGAAIAITAALMADGKVEDDWLYFGDEPYCDANQLLEKLRLQTVAATGTGLRHSSEALVLGHERQLGKDVLGLSPEM